MAEPGRLRGAAAGLALAALLLACGGDGPVGAPGGRDGVELRYRTPRLQVFPVGPEARVVLSFSVRRTGQDGLEPWPGAVFEVRRESGAARPEVSRVATDERGVATVSVTTPGTADETQIEFILRGDRRQHLPFDVVTATTRGIDLAPGGIAEIDPPSEGVLLRFDLAAGEKLALVPHQLDAGRSGASYRILHQAGGFDPKGVAFGIEPPTIPGSRPGVRIGDAGHVRPGTIEPGGLAPAAAIPPSLNVESCLVEVSRDAPLRYVGRHVALYVDGPTDLHQARIDSLGRTFDESIFPTNTDLFGPTTDRDGNGVVLVVMTPELRGEGGVYCDALRTIGAEVFYTTWNPLDPIGAPMGTLAHEHQHLINAGHHLRTRGAIGDDRWVNEGLSFVAEALNGFWRASLLRIWLFLNGQNGGMSMLPLEYGHAFADEYQMFFLYLGDRFGRDVYRRLGTSGRHGVANVEHVTGMPFDSLVRDWFVASAVSGSGLDVPPRFQYTSIDLGGMADEIAACQCLPRSRFEGMTLEPLHLDGPFDVFRSLEGYDADYYSLSPPEGAPDRRWELYFDVFRGRSTRLAVVRLR